MADRPSPVAAEVSGRIAALDGLRAPVIFVLLVHFASLEPAPGSYAQWVFHFIVDLGFLALDPFFVLSGFLITGILLDTRRSESYFATFYARRFLRIFPLYYGFLIAYFLILSRVAWWGAEIRLVPLQHFLYWSYTTNFVSQASVALPGSTYHLWSLAVEEQFYLVWPLLVRVLSTASLKKVCIACMVAAPVSRAILALTLGATNESAYLMTPARVDGLALGSIMALWAREPGRLDGDIARLVKPVAIVATIAIAGLILYDGHLHAELGLSQVVGVTAAVYLAGVLVHRALFARPGSLLMRALTNRPVRQLGQYWYAIYVLHGPLAFALAQWNILRRSMFDAWIDHPLGAEVAYVTTMVVLSIAAGALSWHAYEKWFLKLRRYLPYGHAAKR